MPAGSRRYELAFRVISGISVVTESSEAPVKLSRTMREVVLHWGEMGTSWGVNRSVGQIHALLYLVGKPLTAEEISETLGLARSNVSTSLKELQDWDLVERQHQLGDRRDFFSADADLWDILLKVADGRKKRELDPTIELLEYAAEACKDDADTPADVRKRIAEMHRFVSTMTNWYEQVKTLPRATLLKLMALGAKVAKFVGM
jgi:DNA-binding transcriptional regulator GbsR (MarR family)